jgi:thioesterase domain-containing protein/acyl carrier protein
MKSSDIARRIRENLAACLHIEAEEIRDSDDFRQLGLDSLAALKFVTGVTEIARELGGAVSIQDIMFHYRQVSALADHIAAFAGEPLVAPSPEPPAPAALSTPSPVPHEACETFFWFGAAAPPPGLGGGLLVSLINLWPALHDRPDLDSLADHFTEKVRSLQPVGPYLLGGFCMGGLLAYEAARRLTAAGQDVRLLVMVHSCDALVPLRLRLVRRLLLSARYPATFLRSVAGRLGGRRREAQSDLVGEIAQGQEGNELRGMFHRLALRSLEKYVARPYDGRLTLLEGDRLPERFFPASIWQTLVRGGVEVHLAPATQWQELLRGAGTAATINECLARVTREMTTCAKSASGCST